MTQQPYDSALKSILEERASEIMPLLLSGIEIGEELNDETLRPPLRADRVYGGHYKGEECIVQIELQTQADSIMAYRLLEYYGILVKKHRKPGISIVIYPFRTTLPETPLKITVGGEEVLNFKFHIIALWERDAKAYLQQHQISIYPLLPTMRNVTDEVLKDAVSELKVVYNDNQRSLGEQLLWFDVFLQRSDTVSVEHKQKVETYMEDLVSMLEESRFVQRAKAKALAEGKTEGLVEGKAEGKAEGLVEGKAEGKAEGRVEGAVEALQQVVVEIVQERFPPLAELAQQKVAKVRDAVALHILIRHVTKAPDENIARWVLDTSAA